MQKEKPNGNSGNQNAVGNKGGTGSPEKYRKQFDEQAYKLCLLGATDDQLADFLQVSVRTINTWKKQQPSFLQSLKRGKMVADAEVAQSLFKRANGYSHPDVDIKVIDGRIVITKLIKHYPPDTTAGIFWLKNRAKENWRDRHGLDIDFERMTDDQLDQILETIIKKANEKS